MDHPNMAQPLEGTFEQLLMASCIEPSNEHSSSRNLEQRAVSSKYEPLEKLGNPSTPPTKNSQPDPILQLVPTNTECRPSRKSKRN